jgi:hypothetical protein
MLERNIDSIIYQAYIKLGDLAYEISVNSKAGLEGTQEQKKLWNRAIAIYIYLEVIENHIEVVNNSVYRIINIEIVEMNKFLACLKELAKIEDYPEAAFIPTVQVPQVIVTNGSNGDKGDPGVSSYTAIAYASDNIGTDFSATTGNYIAFKTSTSPIPFIVSSFAGLWKKYVGEDGDNGIDGEDGEDGNVIIYGTVNPTVQGNDGDSYINTVTNTLFGPKTSGVWPTGIPLVGPAGEDGEDGLDGNTLRYGTGSPSNALGVDGDFYIDISADFIYGPKASSMWPSGTSIIGPIGNDGNDGVDGSDGADGTSSTVYQAWADDAIGTGFTTTFDQNKEYTAFLTTETGLTTTVDDFAGLWTKYRGDGDRWNTTSVTSMTIGTGIQNMIVGLNLAYSTGQRVVIALNNDEDNRMEGYVRTYDNITGQLTVDVSDIFGAGTYTTWDVNISGVPSQVITSDSYFGEIYVEENTAGTPQALSSTYAKISQFTSSGAVSPGVTISPSTDDISLTVRGAYKCVANLSVSCSGTNNELIIQLFRNGVALVGTQSRILIPASTDIKQIIIDTVQDLNSADVIDVRAKVVSGTPNLLIEEGRLSVATTGSPSTPDFTTFSNLDLDTGTETIDSFVSSLAYGVMWEVVIRKGSNRRISQIKATWEGIDVNYDVIGVIDIGTVDVILSVDISGGDVRLRGTATSDDWIISGNRTLIK